jgi:actin-related protein
MSAAHLIPYTPRLFATPRNGLGKRARPECICIVDLGHGGSHIVPVIGDGIVWHAVRRHVISQRLITNLLKETLSFRQWDMMDEPWLVGHIKESCCFVAGRAGHRGQGFDDLDTMSPKDWSFAALTEMCQARSRLKNRIVQEYVLPDYSGETLVNKFGYIKSGPGRITTDRNERRQVSDEEFIGGGEVEEGTFASGSSIGKGAKGRNSAMNGKNTTENDSGNGDEGEDEEDDDDDFDVDAASNSDSGADGEASSTMTKRKKKALAETTQSKRQAAVSQKDDDAEQILVLERERFQVPEVMFNPGIIGLDDAPLHDVIKASIDACQEEARGPLWGNIVLVGGGASMRNIKTRLYNELRPLAPAGVPLTIWSPER